jgi:hypothetical protein
MCKVLPKWKCARHRQLLVGRFHETARDPFYGLGLRHKNTIVQFFYADQATKNTIVQF